MTEIGKKVPVCLGSAVVGEGVVSDIRDDGSVEMTIKIDDVLVADLFAHTAPLSVSIAPQWENKGTGHIHPPIAQVVTDERLERG